MSNNSTTNSNNNNVDTASDYFTFTLPGAPLTTDSTPAQLHQARNQLQEQTQGLPFPIPDDMPIGLEVVFVYPPGVHDPGAMARIDVARELTLGVLYSDNGSVSSNKSISAAQGPQGSTRIRIRVLEADDIPTIPDWANVRHNFD